VSEKFPTLESQVAFHVVEMYHEFQTEYASDSPRPRIFAREASSFSLPSSIFMIFSPSAAYRAFSIT